MDMKVSSTIGFERRHNDLLREDDEDRFVERATASLPPQPPNFQAVVDINRGPLLREDVEAHPLTPRQVEQKQRAGRWWSTCAPRSSSTRRTCRSSVSIPAVQAGFGTKLSWLADRAQEVVLIGRDDEDGIRAALLAAAVGITRIGGYLAGGMTSWREEKRSTGRIERIDVAGAARARRAGPGHPDPRRARAGRVGRAAHPGLHRHSLPRRPRHPRRASTRSSRSP